MNKAIIMGRLTRDPNVTYSQGAQPVAVARYTVAVDRRVKRDQSNPDQQTADFISCVSLGKQGEFVEKYFHQGTKICLCGRIQTGSYTNKEGQKVYTTDILTEEVDFAESKAAAASSAANNGYTQAGAPAPTSQQAAAAQAPQRPTPQQARMQPDADGFMNIGDGLDGFPF